MKNNYLLYSTLLSDDFELPNINNKITSCNIDVIKPILPQTGFVRISTILKVYPVGKSTWWAGVKSGRFPKPVKLGARTTAWRVEDIQELIKQMGGM